MVKTYGGAALESASGVELVVALYDGLIRFLGNAAAAAERGDVKGRREAARRALDIIIHLQATLRPDVGGKPALVLAEFYASIFALILRASLAAAPGDFHHAIRCVRTVREAWHQVSLDPTVAHVLPRDLQTRDEKVRSGSKSIVPGSAPGDGSRAGAGAVSTGWMA
jgi:flagellar protein FliS